MLTSKGEVWAAKIVRLHRLWEVYLADYLGIGVERVHRSAEEMEHIITPELERELTFLLKDPQRDPHHQPIPPSAITPFGEFVNNTYSNPYAGTTFFEFFAVLLQRLWGIFGGDQSLVADEIQMLVLVGVAASAALVGTFLVLRKMTMLANSISHTILLGIVIAFLFTKDDLSMHGQLDIQAMLIAAPSDRSCDCFSDRIFSQGGAFARRR